SDRAEGVEETIRIELHIAARRDAAEPVQCAFLVQPTRDARGDIGPVILFAEPGNVAQHSNAPGLLREVRTPNHLAGAQSRRSRAHVGKIPWESQAAKRNLKPDDVALRGQLCLRVPHGIKREVGSVALAPQSIGLNTGRIAGKEKSAALIVKGIERNLDPVIIIEHLLPASEMRANLVRLIVETDHYNVDVLFIVAKVSVC